MTPPTPTEVEALALELEASGNFAGFATFIDDARWILARFVRREKHERVVAHIESSHNEVVCSSTLRHADDGGDPVPLLTCMTWDSHRLRAEHERKCEEHVELQIEYTKLCAETSRLRAELRGQRCDGSGNIYYRAPGQVVGEDCRGFCPRCPACKPTPNSDKPCDIHGVGLHTDNCNRGRTPESVSVLEQHCSDADRETIAKMRDESYAAGYSAGRDDAARLNVQEVVHVVKLHEDTLRALVAAAMVIAKKEDRDVAAWDYGDHLLAKLKETKG